MTASLLGAFALLTLAWIIRSGIIGHRAAIRRRHRLLDEANALITDPVSGVAPDQFPIVTGRIADGRRIEIALIADTMVTRRLPQLWLSVTLFETGPCDRPAIGALARPTGAEYYSLVHSLAEWMTPPNGTPLLMRGDGRATTAQSDAAAAHFDALFADPKVKEAVITAKAVRLIYQASQGSRAAHMFLRQPQFELETVPAETIALAIALAAKLSGTLADPGRRPVLQAA